MIVRGRDLLDVATIADLEAKVERLTAALTDSVVRTLELEDALATAQADASNLEFRVRELKSAIHRALDAEGEKAHRIMHTHANLDRHETDQSIGDFREGWVRIAQVRDWLGRVD